MELLPVDMSEEFFSGEDLESSRVEPTLDDGGLPAVSYQVEPARQDDYADWTQKHIGDKSADTGIAASANSVSVRLTAAN